MTDGVVHLAGFSLQEMRSWGCPAGTVYSAGDQMVTLPDGSRRSWSEMRRRGGKQHQPQQEREDGHAGPGAEQSP